jgi:hypothetical protein
VKRSICARKIRPSAAEDLRSIDEKGAQRVTGRLLAIIIPRGCAIGDSAKIAHARLMSRKPLGRRTRPAIFRGAKSVMLV